MSGRKGLKNTPRNAMVMNAHHHRWATRKTIDATRGLKKSHAVHVAVHKGKRIKLNKLIKKQQAALQNTTPQGRGSFDAFFAGQFGNDNDNPFAKKNSNSQPNNNDVSSALDTLMKQKLKLSPYTSHFVLNTQGPVDNFHQYLDDTDKDLLQTNGIDPQDIQLRPINAYFADLGIPCLSAHNTLAHLYAAENLWFHRFNNMRPSQDLHNLWETPESAQGQHWGDYFSQKFNLQQVDIDETAFLNDNNNNNNLTKSNKIVHVLDLSLDEQYKLQNEMLSHLGLQLDQQCTDWVNAIQSTNELDLFEEFPYFSTSFKLNTLDTQTTTTDNNDKPSTSFIEGDVPQSLATGALNAGVQFITKEQFEAFKTQSSTLTRFAAINHLALHATHHRGQLLSLTSQFTGEQTTVDFTAFKPEWDHIHSKAFRWA